MNFSSKKTPLIISAVIALSATVIICSFAISCSSQKLKFKTCFYFVCYTMEDNSVSASSISSAVNSYGGAGYILEHDGKYYVTVSCYYSKSDADGVCKTLRGRNLDCLVLKIETTEYALQTISARKNSKLFLGNLTTLEQLAKLAYDCSNALDTGEYGQSKAKAVVCDIKSALEGLQKSNSNNCFTDELKRLVSTCDETTEGIIYSKDLRKLQIAIADTIINVKLF